jgi:ABC-type Fe3+ transport system substrate-binding protein
MACRQRHAAGLATMALLALVMARWCVLPAAGQPLDQLYAAAKEEQALTVEIGGPAADYGRAARAFEQKFPGISVSVVEGPRSRLRAAIEEQAQNGKIASDVIIAHTVQDFVRLKQRGLLLPFKPDGFNSIASWARDNDGAWIAISACPMFYAYNPERVWVPQVPHLAIDFLHANFTGRLVSTYPSDDDFSLFAFVTIVRKYGWGFMDRYMAQQPKFAASHLEVARSVGSGESFASFDTTVSTVLAVQQEGGKITLTGPKDDYLPVAFIAEAILKDAPHKNAARLFVTWFLSKEWQSQMGTYSARGDVAPPSGLPALSAYRLEDSYLEFMMHEDMRVEVRERFARYTGRTTNTGGGR